MALTFTKVKHNIGLNHRMHIYDVTFDNSYPTGGEVVTAANFGLNNINGVDIVANTATAANNRVFGFDSTNSKIVIYTAITTEATNASDQSAVTCRCLV